MTWSGLDPPFKTFLTNIICKQGFFYLSGKAGAPEAIRSHSLHSLTVTRQDKSSPQ